MFKQSHQGCDFLGRPVPIFLRKGIDRQHFDAEFERKRDQFPHGLNAFLVTGNARETAQLSPSAVSIHDYGKVFRQQVRFELREQIRVGGRLDIA